MLTIVVHTARQWDEIIKCFSKMQVWSISINTFADIYAIPHYIRSWYSEIHMYLPWSHVKSEPLCWLDQPRPDSATECELSIHSSRQQPSFIKPRLSSWAAGGYAFSGQYWGRYSASRARPVRILIWHDSLSHMCTCTLNTTMHLNFMMTSSDGYIFRVTGISCGEFTGHRWIPLTKASDAEL